MEASKIQLLGQMKQELFCSRNKQYQSIKQIFYDRDKLKEFSNRI